MNKTAESLLTGLLFWQEEMAKKQKGVWAASFNQGPVSFPLNGFLFMFNNF